MAKKKSYQELIREMIESYGTSYMTSKAVGITQSQLIKHERGQTSDTNFTAQMISTLLTRFSEDEVFDAIKESVTRWEKKQDKSKK